MYLNKLYDIQHKFIGNCCTFLRSVIIIVLLIQTMNFYLLFQEQLHKSILTPTPTPTMI